MGRAAVCFIFFVLLEKLNVGPPGGVRPAAWKARSFSVRGALGAARGRRLFGLGRARVAEARGARLG